MRKGGGQGRAGKRTNVVDKGTANKDRGAQGQGCKGGQGRGQAKKDINRRGQGAVHEDKNRQPLCKAPPLPSV